ncbi:DNA polymerase sliding clamp [Thermoplasmatales archaeon]|nr:DNA polymerase sliding clamp [Thermoplasmatales archaeon]
MVPKMEKMATGVKATFEVEQMAMRKIMRFFPYAMDTHEVLINVNGSGVRFYGMDERRSRIGIFYINKTDMASFKYDGEQTFAVDPADFKSVTNELGSGAMMKFNKNGEKIEIETGDAHKKTVGTISSTTPVYIPDLDMPYGMTLNGKWLYTAIQNLEDMGAEDITFQTVSENGKIILKLSGKRDQKTEVITMLGEKNSFPEGQTARYVTDLLLKTLRLVRDDQLLLRYKTDIPLKMGIRLQIKNKQHEYPVKGYYIVAPLVKD